MVSAWATAQGLCLGQVKTDAKSNEIIAIPKLLQVLALTGRVVAIDAMGCQTAIARAIHTKGGDYVLSLKGNQTRLHDDIRTFFLDAEAHAFAGTPHTTAETVDGDHGRIEVRPGVGDRRPGLVDRPNPLAGSAQRPARGRRADRRRAHDVRDAVLHLQPAARCRDPRPGRAPSLGDQARTGAAASQAVVVVRWSGGS